MSRTLAVHGDALATLLVGKHSLQSPCTSSCNGTWRNAIAHKAPDSGGLESLFDAENSTSAGSAYGATLWRTVPEKGELEARAELSGHAGAIRAALWREGGVAATLDDAHLRSWQLGEGRAEVSAL